MSRDRKRNSGRTGGKRKFRLMLTALLGLCYLSVFVWFIVFGFGGGADPDEAPGSPAPDPPTTPADPAEPSGGFIIDIFETHTDAVEFPPAVKVRGLYVAAWYAGIEARIAEYIDICATTEINALVIDVKDDWGHITFPTDTPGLSSISMNIIPDIEQLVSRLKSHDIYTIARIVCFRDPLWSLTHPELAIQNTLGEPWMDSEGNAWLNPYNPDSWGHIAAAALEAVRVGFDEIQLDYVRFPTDGRLSEIEYGAAAADKTRIEVINEFVEYMRETLAPEGIRLSADVFGIIAISDGDARIIGQDIGLFLHNVDSLCPMIYPSHFANKRQNGVGQIINGVLFEAPDLDPYGVVYNILLEVRRHMSEHGEYAIIRPYLQDFTASYLGEGYYQVYAADEVRAQIEAVYDAGFDEWILWNHFSIYSVDAFEPAG